MIKKNVHTFLIRSNPPLLRKDRLIGCIHENRINFLSNAAPSLLLSLWIPISVAYKNIIDLPKGYPLRVRPIDPTSEPFSVG